MQTIRTSCRALIMALGLLAPTGRAAEPVPRCLKDWLPALRALEAPERRQVLRAVNSYDRPARDGVELFLDYRAMTHEDEMERLHQALLNFRVYQNVPNPFQGGDQAMMAAIAFVDRNNPGVVNFHRVIGDLGQETTPAYLAQAAAFDLRIAREAGASNVSAFRVHVSFNGVTVEFDVAEGLPGANPLAVGLHENKSFVVPFDPNDLLFPVEGSDHRFVYADNRITQLAQEFDRHIVIHQGTNFANWHLNMRPQMELQRSEIEQMLLKQFESIVVTSRFNENQIVAMKSAFLQRVPQNLRFR